MSAKKRIAPLPHRWTTIVVSILQDGDIHNIRWTYTAEQEFHHFGFISKEQAYDYCIDLLNTPGICGEMITGMYDQHDQTHCETWAILGKHPLGSPTDVYVKIGLHQNKVILNLFSLHIDRKGDLRQAIHDYLANKSKNRKK
jgi:hypothetical protein